VKIIYRKSDRLIVGHVFPRRTDSDDIKALTVELQNIINSELGGVADDYGYLDAPGSSLTPGRDLRITEDLKLVSHESQYTRDRRSALKKLIQLGLTEGEVQTISG